MKKENDPHSKQNGSEQSVVNGWLLSHTAGGYALYRAFPTN